MKCERCTRPMTTEEAETAAICTKCMKANDFTDCPKCIELQEHIKNSILKAEPLTIPDRGSGWSGDDSDYCQGASDVLDLFKF